MGDVNARKDVDEIRFELGTVSSCLINNLLIDTNRIIEELQTNKNCPITLLYMMKGYQNQILVLRNSVGKKINDCVSELILRIEEDNRKEDL